DCGFHPSVAATTNRQASTAPTPASMFLRKRTCPGTSTKAISRPDGNVVQAKPRSMVRPRAFSSANRSGSIPVRPNTSVDFPWSTWPAVAITGTPHPDRPATGDGYRPYATSTVTQFEGRDSGEAGEGLGQHRVVGGVDG